MNPDVQLPTDLDSIELDEDILADVRLDRAATTKIAGGLSSGRTAERARK